MAAQAYPLQWPDHIPRSTRRENSRFRTNYDNAMKNVVASLRGFATDGNRAVTAAVMSSNMDLLNKTPPDPGVAVWFTWDGMSVCIPVDRYSTPAENLQAIHHIIEARRTELRHGTLNLVRASFAGFKALPPPPGTKPRRAWTEVLGINSNSTKEQIDAAYKERAKKVHPDSGGSTEAFQELNAAREEALSS
jgi:hypothetical protein